jgi:uncharacterized membrane protein HdeD (DUF308 family)
MDVVTAGATIAAVTAGIVEVLKRTGFNAERWGGVAALLTGTVLMVAGTLTGGITGTSSEPLPIFLAFLAGATAGLTASGAYSATRAAIEK